MTTAGEHRDDSVRREYARLAPHYDAKWSFYVGATTRATLARLAIKPTSRVLDVGCGTGVLLQQLSQSCPQAQLAGIDPVPEMLAVARRKLPTTVELRENCAERLPFCDESFDVVASCNVFHFIRQPTIALTEMTRVLRRGGQLVITDWCGDFLTCRILDCYLRLFKRGHFKVYDVREFQRLLKDAGSHQANIERYKINWLWGLMTAKATKNATESATYLA